MATQYADSAGVRIAYEDLGGAGGEPLLLVMGLGVSRFWWPPAFVAALVAAGFHVVAYDQRDAGESDRIPGAPASNPFAALFGRRPQPYTAEDMTDDAMAVLDAVGWESAHLFGASMGGLLVQRAALRYPTRVRTITSFAAVPSDAGQLRLLRYLRPGLLVRIARRTFPEGRAGDVEAGMSLARELASPGYPFDDAAARRWVEREADLGISGVRDTEAQSRQIGAGWSGGRLAGITCPALVVHGDADQLLRTAAARNTAAAIPGARLLVLPGVGHDLPAAVYEEIAGAVRALAGMAD